MIGDPLGDCTLERRIATAEKAPHHSSSRQKLRLTAKRNAPDKDMGSIFGGSALEPISET
jgi:hypothetical protein